mmetsp:Transcript_28791/g.66947  ORF Transcript_28791/g.66947 Transcript_28791/m.66947 type:complete len:988 (+) Transcript_28791:138-3101(+)
MAGGMKSPLRVSDWKWELDPKGGSTATGSSSSSAWGRFSEGLPRGNFGCDLDSECDADEFLEENEEDEQDGLNTTSFGELSLDARVVAALQSSWRYFLKCFETAEQAGEAIYTALFDAEPDLQRFFSTAHSVQAMRFVSALSNLIDELNHPKKLRCLVEMNSFLHLHLGVTVEIFITVRDIILDVVSLELGSRLPSLAHDGWMQLLNYVGGAMLYIQGQYATKMKTIRETWQATLKCDQEKSSHGNGFQDVVLVHAIAAGHGMEPWFQEVLKSFDVVVSNACNSERIQEECDLLALRVSKHGLGPESYSVFKTSVLAALRCQVPQDWSSSHETAWAWLWDSVEQMLRKHEGKLPLWEASLRRVLSDAELRQEMRKDVFVRFFASCPAAEDCFRRSDGYLSVMADKVLQMALDLHTDVETLCGEVEMLGLRHVTYTVQAKYIAPFVSAFVEAFSARVSDSAAIDGFAWSLNLIGRMLARAVGEGSTLVMKTVTTPSASARHIKKVLASAPRADRASWVLFAEAGQQSMSPLEWVIRSGNRVEVASAMLRDVLTIRGDRERYYSGMEALFARHPDVVGLLCDSAPALLLDLLDGLSWRSAKLEGGARRVHFYVKHLLINQDGSQSTALHQIADLAQPQLVQHPLVECTMEAIWCGMVQRTVSKRVFWIVVLPFLGFCAQACDPCVSVPCKLLAVVLSFAHIVHIVRSQWKDKNQLRNHVILAAAILFNSVVDLPMCRFVTAAVVIISLVTTWIGYSPAWKSACKFVLYLAQAAQEAAVSIIPLGLLVAAYFATTMWAAKPQALSSLDKLILDIGAVRELSTPTVLLSGMIIMLLINIFVARMACLCAAWEQSLTQQASALHIRLLLQVCADAPTSCWDDFVKSMNLERHLEFYPGNPALSGGIQVWEAPSLHPVVHDPSLRVGGTANPRAPWPAEIAEEDARKNSLDSTLLQYQACEGQRQRSKMSVRSEQRYELESKTSGSHPSGLSR